MPPSANAMIKAVVFDMDGVLCDYRIERRLALLAEWSGRSADAIHAAIWRSGFEDDEVAPNEILYFDDDEPLVMGAREAGLRAYRVGGAAAVRAALAAHGLL
jgi:FMN phosphatase YigB (HAD superfamily)